MQRHYLGNSNLEVSAIGLGSMPMSAIYGDFDEGEATATIHQAIDLGINFIDTAQGYANGENEAFLGRVLQGQHEQVVLATKFGNIRLADGSRILDGRPEHVGPACEESLDRLNVGVIDLLYLHRVDPNIPLEDTVGAMARLVEQGKVLHLGLCEIDEDALRRACSVHPITALQSEYSLWTRDPEKDVLVACQTLGVGFVAFSPLGRGFLTGGFSTVQNIAENDRRRIMPRFQDDNLRHNAVMLESVREVADNKGCTMAQIALAWLLNNDHEITPIPGTKKREHLELNAQAANLTLSSDELEILDNAFPPGSVAGERFAVIGEKAK